MDTEHKRELELGNDVKINFKKPKIEANSVTLRKYRTLDSMDTDILFNVLKGNGISEEVADAIRSITYSSLTKSNSRRDNLKGTTIKMLNKDSLIQKLGLKIGDAYQVLAFIEFRTLADSISETVGQFSSFSVPPKARL